jgi:hypothetical protein
LLSRPPKPIAVFCSDQPGSLLERVALDILDLAPDWLPTFVDIAGGPKGDGLKKQIEAGSYSGIAAAGTFGTTAATSALRNVTDVKKRAALRAARPTDRSGPAVIEPVIKERKHDHVTFMLQCCHCSNDRAAVCRAGVRSTDGAARLRLEQVLSNRPPRCLGRLGRP